MTKNEFYTYEEWLYHNPDLDTDEMVECPECSGVGYFTHTDKYGNVAKFYCDYCGGRSKVEKSYVRYKKEYEKDKKRKLHKWLKNVAKK